jgi:hypothetical protein
MEEYISKSGFGADKALVENNRVCKQRAYRDKSN